MRAFDCVCDRHLEAADDEKLLDIAQAHVRQDHPEMQLVPNRSTNSSRRSPTTMSQISGQG
jgi:hypothetical protein